MRHALLFTLLLSTPALAADIFSTRPSGNWSDPTLWPGGIVPGPLDHGYVGNVGTIVFDLAAPSEIGGAEGNAHTYTFEKSFVFGGFGLRESVLNDSGFDLAFGLLSNSGHSGGGSFNAGQLVREGGVFTIGRLDLGRATGDMGFRPGDVVLNGYTTTRLFDRWPSISVTQDPTWYADNLGEGLSFDSVVATMSLGYTGPGDLATIVLNWDADLTGSVDWTMRWAGDHVAELQNWYAEGHLIIGSTPTGYAFDLDANIFYDVESGYTYVGFFSTDGDGVCQASDGDDTDSDGYPDDCAPIGFSGLLPGIAGHDNGFVAWDLSANTRWRLVAGAPGNTPVPGCPGMSVSMSTPRVLASGGSQNGVVAELISVPGNQAGRQAVVQIVELTTCRMSDPMTVNF